MNSRILSGWLLIVGPLAILTAFLMWPTSAETAQEELLELAKNPSSSIGVMALFITGITLLFCGLSIASRAIDESKWSSLSVVSATLFPLVIPIMMGSVGLNFGAVRLFETSPESASAIYLTGYHLTDVADLLMGISFVFFAVALVDQFKDSLRRGIGFLYLIIGVVHIISVFAQEDAMDIAAWMGMFIVSIAFGIVVLRAKASNN